ncbi:DUF1878 family protein [Cytobacillus sp. FJAT-54145]|uniref:DUF1878 family protein n=1 Tax=Cytobacillus spartinae TaxID=3299023 RepID=A0ABW6KBC7_9BACI
MNYEILLKKIEKLEYHQSLLLKMVTDNQHDFFKLVIKYSLDQKDVESFHKLCEHMSTELEKQKAEGFVYFHPLYEEFRRNLHPNVPVEEVIFACLNQRLFEPLMVEFKKYLSY